MYIALCSADIVICYLLITLLKNKQNSIFWNIIQTNNLFCIQYLIFSLGFIFFERFAVWKPLVILLFFDILLYVFVAQRKEKKIYKIKLIEKNEICILVTMVLLIPFLYRTSEDIGTVSDQGAYFFHTIVLMEEKEEEVHTLSELGKISDTVDQGLLDLQEEMTIYYHYDNETYYYPHALRTWCVFPALAGKLLGLWNCMKASAYLLILTSVNMFFLCRKISAYKRGEVLSIVLFSFSPLILYIGKAGLSECLTLYLFILAMNLLILEKCNKILSIIGGIVLGLIGFVHVSIYVYMPIITIILALYIYKQRNYIYTQLIQLILFFLSVIYDYNISPIYFERQYSRFTLGGRLSYGYIILIIGVLIVSLIMLQIIVYKKKIYILEKIRKFIYSKFTLISIICIFIICLRTIYFAYCLGFTDWFMIPEGTDAGTWNLRSTYAGTGWSALSHLNIVNVGRAVGIIGIIIFMIFPFLKKKTSEIFKCIYLCGLYGMLIFTVLQCDTPSNYYASRYFVPFLIPIIVISIVVFVEKRRWILYIMVVAIMFNFNYWPSFFTGAPQFGQYTLLKDTLNAIPRNEIVYLDPSSEFLNTRLTSNLRIINYNEVYNLENFDEVFDFFKDQNLRQYIISDKEIWLENQDLELILTKTYKSQYSFGNGANGSYATTNPTYDIVLYIYRVT